MTLRIEALEFAAVLGILEHERTAPQRVLIDAEITYAYTPGQFLDYARIAALLRETIEEGEFGLIEEAIEALFERLKERFAQIETVKIAICKPDILPDCRVWVKDFRAFL